MVKREVWGHNMKTEFFYHISRITMLKCKRSVHGRWTFTSNDNRASLFITRLRKSINNFINNNEPPACTHKRDGECGIIEYLGKLLTSVMYITCTGSGLYVIVSNKHGFLISAHIVFESFTELIWLCISETRKRIATSVTPCITMMLSVEYDDIHIKCFNKSSVDILISVVGKAYTFCIQMDGSSDKIYRHLLPSAKHVYPKNIGGNDSIKKFFHTNDDYGLVIRCLMHLMFRRDQTYSIAVIANAILLIRAIEFAAATAHYSIRIIRCNVQHLIHLKHDTHKTRFDKWKHIHKMVDYNVDTEFKYIISSILRVKHKDLELTRRQLFVDRGYIIKHEQSDEKLGPMKCISKQKHNISTYNTCEDMKEHLTSDPDEKRSIVCTVIIVDDDITDSVKQEINIEAQSYLILTHDRDTLYQMVKQGIIHPDKCRIGFMKHSVKQDSINVTHRIIDEIDRLQKQYHSIYSLYDVQNYWLTTRESFKKRILSLCNNT